MCVTGETIEKVVNLFMHHGVVTDGIDELGFLLRVRKFPVEQQVTALKIVRFFSKLLDWVTAVEQDPFITVDVGYFRLASCGRHEAWVKSKKIVVGKTANIYYVRPR